MNHTKLETYFADMEELFSNMLSEHQHGLLVTPEGARASETASCLRDYISRARECREEVKGNVPVKHTDRIRRTGSEQGIG